MCLPVNHIQLLIQPSKIYNNKHQTLLPPFSHTNQGGTYEKLVGSFPDYVEWGRHINLLKFFLKKSKYGPKALNAHLGVQN